MELAQLFHMGSKIIRAPGHRTCVTEAIQIAMDNRDLVNLIKIKVNPTDYVHAENYFRDAQAVALFKKLDTAMPGVDRKAAALAAWFEAERKCAWHNARLSRLLHGCETAEDMRLYDFFGRVRRRVKRWLGPIPNELQVRFGPGSVLGAQGQTHTVPDKMTNKPTTTESLRPYLYWWEQSGWARARNQRGLLWKNGELNLEVRRASLWGTAPKNALTYRSTEIGQSINVSYQLFLGQTIKDNIRRVSNNKWNLKTQPDIHRILAASASKSGRRATIDLAQASDSICKALVKLCVPADWFELFDDLRSHMVETPDGKVVYLEKFSGMGNGFTFELESVLFMSICQEVLSMRGLPCTAGKDVFVFGDDIIVDTEGCSDVILALRLSGFEINVDKTFIDGPFRESCGGDFFDGVAVRPYYLKELPSEPQHIITFANGLRRVAKNHDSGVFGRDYLLEPWMELIRLLPSAIRRCRGPEALGDIVLHDEPRFWSRRHEDGIRYVRVYRPILSKREDDGSITRAHVSWKHFPPSVQLASRVNGYGDRHGVIPRDNVAGHALCWHPYS